MSKEFKTHKSWGMVGLSRVFFSGSQQLFGSDITNHTGIQLRVKHAAKSRELGRDWIMGDDLICEIMLSPNQFADMLANMNVGDGVPCTITWTRQDGSVEFQPEENKLSMIEADRVKSDEDIMNSLKDCINQLATLVNTNKMPKTVGKETLSRLHNVYKYLDSSGSDFLRSQAKKEIENMVTEAKSQVADFVNHKIYSVGLEHLINAKLITPQLLEKEDDINETARITATDNIEES